MKTLLLTSAGDFVTDREHYFLPKPLREMRLAYITTASKGVEDRTYVENRKKRFTKENYNYKEIDIEGKSEDDLRSLLKDFEVIYVGGGNTFYLLKAVRESGFDIVIKELIEKGVIYIGSSAGSYIVCPTIVQTNWKPREDTNYDCGLADLTGMSFVPFIIVAHYIPKYKKGIEKGMSKTEYPVRLLTDDQAFLVQDDAITLIGDGEEVIL